MERYCVSDNFSEHLIFLNPAGWRIPRNHVHTFHSFMRAVLTFRLGNVHVTLPWSMNFVNNVLEQIWFSRFRYSHLVGTRLA